MRLGGEDLSYQHSVWGLRSSFTWGWKVQSARRCNRRELKSQLTITRLCTCKRIMQVLISYRLSSILAIDARTYRKAMALVISVAAVAARYLALYKTLRVAPCSTCSLVPSGPLQNWSNHTLVLSRVGDHVRHVRTTDLTTLPS